MREIVARWREWSGDGVEHLVLREDAGGIRAESVVLGGVSGEWFAVGYEIECDPEWRTRSVHLRLIGEEQRLHLSSDGAGKWRDGSGKPLPMLDGAIDVDITLTPFTNTLPIRRLALEVGESEDILTAYIEVPGLTLTTDQQRYTCLAASKRYRYESVDGDFMREIEVDEHGLVLVYPGLFRRIAPGEEAATD